MSNADGIRALEMARGLLKSGDAKDLLDALVAAGTLSGFAEACKAIQDVSGYGSSTQRSLESLDACGAEPAKAFAAIEAALHHLREKTN